MPQNLPQTFEQQIRERTAELHRTIHTLEQEIDRHREANVALTACEQRYRALYEQNPSMYFSLAPDGLILSVNQFGADALGYRADELLGQSVLRVFHPDDHHTVLNQLRICSSRPQDIFDWEIQKVRKDGSRLWVKERARLITDPQGHPIILVVCEDITDRRKAEEAVHEREQRLRATTQFLNTLIREAPLPIVSLNSQGTISSWNQAATSLFGWTEAEVLGRELPYVPPGQETEADALWEQGVRNMIRGPLALRRQRKDGTLVDVLLWPVFVYDDAGRLSTAVGLYVDQSDLQRAEDGLRESEGRLRAFAAAIPDLALVLDAQGRYVEVLSHKDHLLYDDASRLTGRLLHEVLPQADADLFLATIRRTIETGQSQRLEYLLNVKAGLRWFEGHTALMQSLPGKIDQVVWVAHDITERKRAEEALRVSEERFAKAFRSSPHPIIVTERDSGRCLEVNEAGLTLFGYRRNEVIGQTTITLGLWPTPDDRARFFAQLAAEGALRNIEFQFYAKDRTPRQCLVSCEPIELNGTPCLVTVGTDITEQKRAEGLLAQELRALKLIARDTPLTAILEAICALMEEQNPQLRCSILLLDTRHRCLRSGAAPSLPPEYMQALDGLPIGPRAGSCGTAAYLGETVIVPDIARDDRWKNYCGLALNYGLAACWSMPIKDPSGHVLGTFALYHRTPCHPPADDLALMARATHLAGIAITRKQAADERERISQDLHDNILQSLYAVGMQLEASKMVAGKSARKAKTHITHAIEQLNQLVQEVRDFIALLRKQHASELDFGRALHQLAMSFSSAEHTAPTLDMEPSTILLINADVGEQLLSIAREALSNSVRHAKAAHRSVTLRLTGAAIQLCVSDDGIGFNPGRKGRRGHGLANMAARAKRIGARFVLTSTPRQGTRVTVEVPEERLHEPVTR